MPIYPLYALLFADSGLSTGQISMLIGVWSLAAILAEVPSGAWADRHSRRMALVAAGLLQAAGYLVWIALPGIGGYAAGFVLWGVGGALASGAFQALLYDGLAAGGAAARYPRVLGRAEAAALAVQVPVAGAATALFAVGGFRLAAWVSVGTCVAAATLAATLPDVRPGRPAARPGYLATLRAGVREATAAPAVRAAALVAVALTGLDGLEELFPLLAAAAGIPVGAVPPALLLVALAGAAGAALGERGARLGAPAVAALMACAALGLGAAGLVPHAGAVLGAALFYGVWQLLLVVADARLQARIEGPARATVTSATAVGGELAAVAVLAAWALGGPLTAVVLAGAAAVALPRRLARAPSAAS